MYKKAWCTCKVVVLRNEGTYCFSDVLFAVAGKSAISFRKKAQRDNRGHFMAMKSWENVLDFVIYSYLKDSAFTTVKRDTKFKTRYVKGVPFVYRRYTKGVTFWLKMAYKRVRGWTLAYGGSSPYKTLLSKPSPPGEISIPTRAEKLK